MVESSGTRHKSNTKCGIDIFVLLPLDLIKIWAEVENLSEHVQSKPFALSDGDALLHLLQGNPVRVSGSKKVES